MLPSTGTLTLMNDVVLILGKTSLTWGQIVLGMAGLSLCLLLLVTLLLLRTRRDRAMEAMIADERAREMDDKVAEFTRAESEMTGRMRTMAEVFGSRQS